MRMILCCLFMAVTMAFKPNIFLMSPRPASSSIANIARNQKDTLFPIVLRRKHSTTSLRMALNSKNENIKKGKLYFTIWTSIYLTCLAFIYYFVDNNFMKAENYGIDAHDVMIQFCTWLDNHIINVGWITNGLRTNPWMTTFAEAYLLTDIIPTTFIAVAIYPFAQKYQVINEATMDVKLVYNNTYIR